MSDLLRIGNKKAFTLRPYQVEALNAIHAALKANDDPVLLQAATGAGKTVMVVRLVNRYFFANPESRFLILAHKKELVEQFHQTFMNCSDIPSNRIGIYCAGLGKREIDRPIVIATVMSFCLNMDRYRYCNLLIIDEAHRVGFDNGSQYDQVIRQLNSRNPGMRILGITATPWRYGHGYIYGDKCRPGSLNLFPRLNHQVKYSRLLQEGHLVELKGIVAAHDSIKADLANVAISQGDYVLDQLGDMMTRSRHIETAREAVEEYCQDRNHICVFACTIDHAEALKEVFGDEATIVHSKLTPVERHANMEAWRRGTKKIMVSVNILVEGFDFPALDCLVMARPTLSPVLYVQAIGRVLRTSPGKANGLLVDLTDNTERFGTNLDNVRVDVPRAVQKRDEKEHALFKTCPKCGAEVHIAVRVCECGHEFKGVEQEVAQYLPDMKEVSFTPDPPEWYTVKDMDVTIHTSRRTNKRLGKVTFLYDNGTVVPGEATIWLCFPDYYDGYAVEQSRKRWEVLSDYPFPDSVEGLLESGMYTPYRIQVDLNDKYPRVVDVEMTPF